MTQHSTQSRPVEPDRLDPDSPGPSGASDGPGADPVHPALEQSVTTSGAPRTKRIDTVVFGVTAVIALAFVAWGIIDTTSLGTASAAGLDWVVHTMGWLFSLGASALVIFVIWLAASKYGRIPLGRDDEAPEFRTVSWIAMMFSAGMGIGLMFFGVAEPLSHFVTPPPGTGEVGNPDAVQTAMATTLFHWTLHPWAIYAVVGLAIAYSVFRRGRSLLISSAFAGLFGERVSRGPVGKVIDMLAIFATLFGSAASLGLGTLQISSGLQLVAGIGEVGNIVLVIITAVLTICFIASAISGISRGIQWLSSINMVLAAALAVFVFVVGPTVFILNLLPTALGSYLQDLAMMAARTDAAGAGIADWLSSWTIFYWAWWVSWTPFVGMFIARISRGRTIRQFVTGVLLVPSMVSLVWFAVFGGAAIQLQSSGVDLAAQDGQEAQLFGMLAELPFATISSIVVMVLVAIFFVSGADAASIVMGTLSQRGTLEPSKPVVIFWGVVTGAVAAIMLIVGGDQALTGLQNITTVAALPFLIVMLLLAVALTKDLQSDPMVVRGSYARAAVDHAVVAGVTEHGDDFKLVIDQTPAGEGVGELVTSTPATDAHAEVSEARVRETGANEPAANEPDGRVAPDRTGGPVGGRQA